MQTHDLKWGTFPGSFFSVATTASTTPDTFNGDGARLNVLAAISCTDTLCRTKDGATGWKLHVDFISSAKKMYVPGVAFGHVG